LPREPTGCLGEDAVLRLLQRTASDPELAAIHEHLARCAACRRFVAEASEALSEDSGSTAAAAAAGADAEPLAEAPSPAAPLAAGAQVSRYVIRRLIGAGAGGAVYEAHDPHLGRLVALKLILRTARPSLPRSEEQALGRLSHPNVVAVHDAGELEGQTFMVMELVEGTTLDQWLEERPRQLDEILDVFADAARGLGAAHAVGLVHRDFKPQNVIVGKDGRARVADFGLAQSIDAGELAPVVGADGGAGSIAGTPAYMAPEQFLGRAADARSDQFSFCVALYRALYGRHPFGADGDDRTLLGFARSVIAGQLRPVPENSGVPAWLERVITRGLSTKPEDRHASMDDVLAAVARGRSTARGPRLSALRPAVLGGAALVLAGVLAWSARRTTSKNVSAAICGNGVVEGNEACDDGNHDDGDACLTTCRWAACGDGHVRRNVEECDDRNRADGDGCSASCLRCSDGDAFVQADGSCYTRHDAPLPWEAAASACREHGAHLVTLRNLTEVRAVQERLLAGRSGGYWIGLRDRGAFGWLTAEPINPLLSWDEGVPADGHCVAAAAARAPIKALDPKLWAAARCDSPLGYVCERPGWTVSPKTNHAYRILAPERRFDDARAACQHLGAHLVTVTSPDENAFVGAQFFGVLWLDAVKRDRNRSFEWSTGERFGFRNFAVGDPDRRDVPDCVVMGEDRKWHDRTCDGREAGPYGTVCEVD
jgi:cysteine-rich repeat protein